MTSTASNPDSQRERACRPTACHREVDGCGNHRVRTVAVRYIDDAIAGTRACVKPLRPG
jgi:hypothetical protein